MGVRNPMVWYFELGKQARLRPVSLAEGWFEKALGGACRRDKIGEWVVIHRADEGDCKEEKIIGGRKVKGDFFLAKTTSLGNIISSTEHDRESALVLAGEKKELSLI